ncbi:tudor domain-containing protein 5 isoform X2 [Trichomycterus rosablanca]|uniref:tudor domain-containing protein 5 isoform X2 n=1 Tax=Trichomycterus rosablanca TaxID=2290929 RepID=UPI002F360B5F
MMDTDQILSGLKKDIRSLLISAKHGLSPEQLRRDYQNMLGHPMPLKILGFRSVLDMVKEMPDAVRLDYTLNGTVLLKAIGDENTRGIEELVSKQRDHKIKLKSGRVGFSPHSSYHQRSFAPVRRGTAPPAVPAQLRSQLRQLLTHGPVGLSELEARYAASFGRALQVTHYGFYSITELLGAASDFITVRQSRTGSLLFLKTENTPVKQMFPSTGASPKQSAGISGVLPSLEKSVISNIKPEEKQSSAETVAVRPKEPKRVGSVTVRVNKEKSFVMAIAKLEKELRQRILESGDAGTVSQELKDKLRKVVAEHSQGMAIHHLPTEYKKMYGEELPLAQCGFLSVTEMVGALSDTFYLQPSTEDGAKHLLIMDHKSNHQSDSSQTDQCPSAELLNLSSDGHYFSYTQSAWEPQNYGGESDRSSEPESEIRITNKTIQQVHSKMVDLFPRTLATHGSVVPLDAVRCQRLKPPTRRSSRELVPVLVEKMVSPSHFYIRFDENQMARTLENMMIEMRSCYSCPEVAERYRLPDEYIRPGQVCCVAPRDMWFYRVVIYRVISSTEVEVYYADFGDLTTVNRSSLRFLKSCYAELPAQAAPSVLVGVKPIKGVWTEEAVSSFQRMCYDRTLVAAVHSYQENFLLIFLCDTHTEEDVYIHTALQAEGHAVACSPASTPVLQQFNPVTLYLKEGQLEEVKLFTARNSSIGVTNEQSIKLQPDTSTIHSQSVFCRSGSLIAFEEGFERWHRGTTANPRSS